MIQEYRNIIALNEFEFCLFDFVCYMGLSRNAISTNTIKFPLAVDLLGTIKTNSDEFRVSLSNCDAEDKIEISRRMGDGLSLVIAEKLYNLEKSTISKIKRPKSESKPDFTGFSGKFCSGCY